MHINADVLTNNSTFMSDTYSCAMTEATDVQIHKVDLLFECVLVRDSLLYCRDGF